MISLDAYKEAFHRLPAGAAEAEVNAETHTVRSFSVREGKPSDAGFSEKAELFIRVSGEKTGYAYTQNIADDPDRLIKQAYENGMFSDMDRADNICAEPLQSVICDETELLDTETLKNALSGIYRTLFEKLSAEGVKFRLNVELQAEAYGQRTVNSHGLDVGFVKPVFILSAGCILDGEMITNDAMADDPAHFDLDTFAEDLKTRMRHLGPAGTGFQSGEQEVILSETAVSQMFMTAWQEFSTVRHAGGAAALAGLLGTKIAGSCLTITDEPCPEGGYPMFADCEGTPGTVTEVVRDGVFTGLLSNRAGAETMGLPCTGNAGRRPLLFGNIATDILVTPKNFCIRPGTSSLREMEQHMKDGILITEYFDLFHSLDIPSGNFSVPCYGVLIRDGKECGTVKGLNMSGNFKEMLKNITEVGSVRQIHPMNFLQNYGIGSCALRVGKLKISGE